MIVAEKMQNAVDQQFGEVLFEADAGRLRFSLACFHGYDHISQEMGRNVGKGALIHGKRQDVGRS
jgi:hypothetical protein